MSQSPVLKSPLESIRWDFRHVQPDCRSIGCPGAVDDRQSGKAGAGMGKARLGAGKADGAMDAGNMLKPALARGELHCVGATTLDEYRQFIEKDAALERRFQKVLVDEPSEEDTIAILRGLKERYEVHHGVTITDGAIIAAAKLSHRYITDRQLPDKAIDLMDEAASRIRMEIDSKPEELDRKERRLIQLKIQREALKKEKDAESKQRLADLEAEIDTLEREYNDLEEVWKAEKATVQGATKIKEQIEAAKLDLESAQRTQDYARMSEIQYGRLPELEKQLKAAQEAETTGFTLLQDKVTAEEIAEVVARWTGIPVSRMLEGEREKLLKMEEQIGARVIGQQEAVVAVSNAVRRARAGLNDENRPLGSFLFLGPTGVGKTELTKALAEYMFDDDSAMVRIDMSEFMEKHSVARLIGAPPGYVGFDQGGLLTDGVDQHPHCVLLLDEIEKAHPDVYNILLQVMDHGKLTDHNGRQVDFRNVILIMTSNAGASDMQKAAIGFGRDKREGEDTAAIERTFTPEFRNRLDAIISFAALSRDVVVHVVEKFVLQLEAQLMDRNVHIELTPEAADWLAEKGYDDKMGARPLGRVIQEHIKKPLAEELLFGRLTKGGVVRVKIEDDKPAFDITGPDAPRIGKSKTPLLTAD